MNRKMVLPKPRLQCGESNSMGWHHLSVVLGQWLLRAFDSSLQKLDIIVLYLCTDSISMKQSEKDAVIGCGSTNEQGT